MRRGRASGTNRKVSMILSSTKRNFIQSQSRFSPNGKEEKCIRVYKIGSIGAVKLAMLDTQENQALHSVSASANVLYMAEAKPSSRQAAAAAPLPCMPSTLDCAGYRGCLPQALQAGIWEVEGLVNCAGRTRRARHLLGAQMIPTPTNHMSWRRSQVPTLRHLAHLCGNLRSRPK